MATLLDLFCGAGGCSSGYNDSGFRVTGVDINEQKNYPFNFIQCDAIEYLLSHWMKFDVVHASPPCQFASEVTPPNRRGSHRNFIPVVRKILVETGKIYVIENVENARNWLIDPILLCGTMFGLRCYRHRYFEISCRIEPPEEKCDHSLPPLLVTTAGANSRKIGNHKSVKNAPLAYGIDWMNGKELSQAIPPSYTRFIGEQLMRVIVSRNKGKK